MTKQKRGKRKATRSPWEELFDQMIAEMMADPRLTDDEKVQLLADLEKPDSEWEPIKIKGEPLSETLIKMRGSRV